MEGKRALVGAPMALAVVALLAALYGGLLRLGWDLPALRVNPAATHGVLMIAGLFATLIAAERAVALVAHNPSRWAYAAFVGPALSAAGAVLLLLTDADLARMMIVLSGLVLVLMYVAVLRRQVASFTLVMALGAYLLLITNALWATGTPPFEAVHGWIAFLVLTIVGERLELARVVRPSRWRASLFFAALAVYVGGVALTRLDLDAGVRVAGIGLIALALWLLHYDIARRTVRQDGLARFMALCLLAGYGWLLVGGLLGVLNGGVVAGPRYDALLHTVLLGFVVSMVFGHAPIIIPALLRVRVPLHRAFYLHLGLLHASLLVRVAGDVLGHVPARQWGGLLNEVAILLFVANTIRSVRSNREAAPRAVRAPGVGQSLPRG